MHGEREREEIAGGTRRIATCSGDRLAWNKYPSFMLEFENLFR